MIWRKILFKPLSLLIVCGSLAFAQSFSPKQPIDFSAITTKPMQIGTILPATCAVGDQFFKSNATPGQNLYACTATNTWTQQAGGSSSSGQLFENRTSINNAASPYTILSTDSYFNCDATGGIVIANLPAATGTGRELTIKNTSGTNTCKFVRNGSDTIDGGTEVGTSDQNAVIKIIDRATGIWDRLHTQSLVGGVSGTTGNNVVDKIKAVTISATPPTTGQVLTATSATAANWQTLGTGGTVTSIGIITVPSWLTVTGSPVTTSGNITIDAAAAQTASRVVATPTTSGAVGLRQLDTTYISASALSGNGTKFATTTGALTNTHCVAIDANGNFIDAGSACGSGGGLGDPGSNGPVVRTALNTTAVATCSDIYKPGCVVSQGDQAPNTAYTDAQNTFSDPGNQYFGKYDVVCDATDATLTADNVLVKKAATGKCVIMTTADTNITTGFWGVLVSGHGTANGKVRRLGVASSISSTGTVNTGDWIFVSTTTNGYVQGSASRPSAGTLVIGRANGPGPNPPVDLLIDPNSAGGSSITLKTNGTNNGSQSTLNLAAGTNVTLTDNGTGTVTIASTGGGGGGSSIHGTAYSSVGQSIPTATETPLSWDSEVEDTGGVHESVTHPTRFTAPSAGDYIASCHVDWDPLSSATNTYIYLRKNGTTVLTLTRTGGGGSSLTQDAAIETVLSTNDYVECIAAQTSGSSTTIASGLGTYMSLTLVGGGGGGVYTQSFTSQSTVALTHNLASTSVQVACYDNATPSHEIGISQVTRTDSNTTTVSFASATSGSCVVIGGAASGGGGGTVTTSGSPTTGAIVTMASATAVQTPSATTTLDSSGNAVFAGTVTATQFIGGSTFSAAGGESATPTAPASDTFFFSSTNHIPQFTASGNSTVDATSVKPTTCTNQAVTAIPNTGTPTCTTITSAYVNNSIALTGTDINTSNQVTATHLAAALPINQGGTGATAVPGSSGNFIYNNAGAFGAKALAASDMPNAPILISTSGPVSDPGGASAYQFNNAAGALTFNAPAGVAGMQRCYRNATGKSGAITIQMAASNTIDKDGANGTSAGTLVSGGALGDAVCIVSDATNHWYAYVQKGTWTNN